MEICYKKLWKLLIDRGLTRSQMRLLADISTVSLAKLGKGQSVTTDTLLKICRGLQCDIGDIVEVLHEQQPVVCETSTQYAASSISLPLPTKIVKKAENITEVFSGRHYVSHAFLQKHLRAFSEGRITGKSLNNNLVRWKKAGMIFSAGRGWYSNLANRFSLNTSPIADLCDFIGGEYPLLDYLCWSTQQLLPYFHHLPGNFFTFVHVEKEALNDLSLALQERYLEATVRVKPTCTGDDFIAKRQNFILLPLQKAYGAEFQSGAMPIEGILVELVCQAKKLAFADEAECRLVIEDILSRYRINMAKLKSLATRRRCSHIRQLMTTIK